MEIVELLANMEFVAGDDVVRARALYEQARQAQLASEAVASDKLDASEPAAAQEGADDATGTTSTARELPEVEPVGTAALTTAAHDAGEPAAPPTVSFQIIAATPELGGLSPAPSFDELVERGWIRTSWGRFWVPQDFVMTILRHRDGEAPAFRALIELRTQDEFRVREGFAPSGILRDIADGIATGQHRPGEVACISRAWIAARLWEAPPSEGSVEDPMQRMSQWVDRWSVLNCPHFALSALLEPASVDAFVDTAFGILTADDATPLWNEFRQAAQAPTALLYPHRAANIDSIVPPLPATTIDRIQWISKGVAEVAFHDFLETKASTLLSALINEVQESLLDPRRLVPRLMETIVEHPVYLHHFVLRALQAPVLLADMLMASATCPLACSLIANWDFRDGGWNREFQARANHTTELLAFEDAVALLGFHLDAGLVSADELAALYLHIYQLASDPRQSPRRYAMLSLLREEIVGASSGVQDSVVATLLARAVADNQPIAAYCASLDLVSEGDSVDRIDPTAMVAMYLDILLPRGERSGFRQLELRDACTLVELAFRCDDATRRHFLAAVDVPTWLQSGPSSPEDPDYYTFSELLGRRVRLHIRVLSRAIAGWPTDVPDSLVAALAQAVHAGATARADRGRVDAFALGLGHHGAAFQERPIALDLAAALRRLEGSRLQQLVTELCQVEEPVVLAGIIANTPPAAHDQIKAHLLTLTPQNSSKAFTLTALQARVEALLNAELPDIAEVFVAAERQAAPGRAVPHRAISALRATVRALFMREDWAGITSFTLPESISEHEKRDANDVVLFYRALSELKKTGGDPTAAEAMFLGLTQRHRGITAYHINLFACRVHRLLGADTLGLLSRGALSEAKRYLVEARRDVRPLVQHSPPDIKALDSNRAMLLLAAGQPQECLQVLLQLREASIDARTEGFRALALARIGSKREAFALLYETEKLFGRSDFLSAIRANIDGHRPFATSLSLAVDDDPVLGIRQAFEAFRRLDHVEQAEVLQSRGRLDLFLLEEVRGACASVVALAPMMRELGMVRNENDISSVLKQLLRSRLLLPQWTVEDQPLGGYSKVGNPGSKDFAISKGTAELAILEALIVDSLDRGNLTSHFTKLLGYGTCRFFFHITYARRANCAHILAHLKTACTSPSPGISYVRTEDLPDFDSMPVGFKAYFNIDSRNIIVVFLALEIGQPIQRAAAAAQ